MHACNYGNHIFLRLYLPLQFGKKPVSNISMYSCSKSAVMMLTKCMALELGSYNIRVNCICPSYITAPMLENRVHKGPAVLQEFRNQHTNKRFLHPEEAANTVVFLSSKASSMIMGDAINICGGYSI